MSQLELEIQTIADVGNSSAKVIFMSHSRITRTIHTIISKIMSLPEYVDDKPLEQLVKGLHEDLIIEISSPSIAQEGIYAIGSKAFTVKDGVKSTFDIDTTSKQAHDISIILPTAIIATNAIQEYYEINKELPAELKLKVDYRTALPLKNFSQKHVDVLKSRLREAEHTVNVRVRDKFIPVVVEYTDAKIVQEGLPTIYALVLIPMLLEKHTVSADDILKKNVLSLDIGEGTTEGNYLTHGKIDSDLSEGDVRGVGHAAVRAKKKYIEKLNSIGLYMELTRQEFINIVRDPSHSRYALAKEILEEANKDESFRIFDFLKQRFNTLKGNVDILVVSGGGATVFRTHLEPLIQDFCTTAGVTLIWIDAEHADMMNCLGLGAMLQNEQEETV